MRDDGPVLPAWVGEIDLADAAPRPAAARVPGLDGAGPGAPRPGGTGPGPAGPDLLDPRYRSARLLVTRDRAPLAVVDVPVRDGRPDVGLLRERLAALPRTGPHDAADRPVLPSTAVAVCTRDRPEHVAVLLDHLAALPEDDVVLLVVDNGPGDDRTRDVVAAAAVRDPRLRYVRDPIGGTSRARNRALAEARARGAEVVAFLDDDVTVGPGWLRAVRRALADDDVACVTGPVLAGTLETASQVASDGALGWTRAFAPRRFALDAPSGSPLFPFAPGEYGVGANFAVRTADALAVGGFDELLGGGAVCRGGEDIEFWVRLVTLGRTLVYEPTAWVWHHHRDSDDALRAQLAGYARGLGGYLAAVAAHPAMRRLAVRRLPGVLRHLARLRRREAAVGVSRAEGGLAPLAVARGAAAYARAARRRRRSSESVRRSRRTGW